MDHDAEKHYELQPLSQRRGSGTALHCNFRNHTLYLDSTIKSSSIYRLVLLFWAEDVVK